MEENKNRTFIDKIWSFFSSVKLAVVLFALIGLTSIIGTIIEQRVSPEKNLQLISRLFGESFAPSIYKILNWLGFMDMYHSWWFVMLLLLFAANLIICSIDRLPRILKLVRERIKPLSEEQFKNISKKEIVLKGKPEKIKEAVGAAIEKAGFNFSGTKELRGYQMYAEKGNYTRLGVYITHFSILLILLGAIIGIVLGFKGYLNLPEGKTYFAAFDPGRFSTDSEESEKGDILDALQAAEGGVVKAAQQLRIDEATLRSKMKKYGIFPLGFGIRCDNFSVDFYGRSDMPKAYKSQLTVIKDGQEVSHKTIEVNNPLTYNGVTFYQSSYGMVPGAVAKGELVLNLISKSGVSETKHLRLDENFTIPGTDIAGKIIDFSPALSFDKSGQPFTYAEQMNNPSVFMEFSEKGKSKFSGWIMKRYPETWALPDGNRVEFVDYRGVQYAGLQVRKDPGVWIVYLGCITISIGLFIAFFMNHKRLWVRLAEEKNGTRIIFAFTANKNKPAFERKVDKMVALLSRMAGGGKQ